MQETTTQRLIYLAVALVALTAGISLGHLSPRAAEEGERGVSLRVGEEGGPSCNVATVRLQGTITTYYDNYYDANDPNSYSPGTVVDSETIVEAIEAADEDPDTLAILLQVDSLGGSPVAAEEIASALRHAKKPSVAMIRGEGLSAAYWAATGAGWIFAAPSAEVGSIGVTSSYLDQTGRNKKDGYVFHSLSTGIYKDMQNTNKELTREEEALIRDELEEILGNFVSTIAVNRSLAVASITPDLASGAPFTASFAKESGLIDEIGGKREVREHLARLFGKGIDDIVLCK